MSILGNERPYQLSVEACKPNYEALIHRERESLVKVAKLKNAIFEYVGFQQGISEKLTQIIGELVVEERCTTYRIEKYIEERDRQG